MTCKIKVHSHVSTLHDNNTSFQQLQEITVDLHASTDEGNLCKDERNIFKTTSNRQVQGTKSAIIQEVPPDGGWGWVICCATFLCNFVVGGTYFSFGIMLPHLIDEFNSDHVTISMIGSVLYGVTQLVGVFVAGFIDICGCRSLCIGGALLGAISFSIAAFLPSNIGIFMIVYAVFGGIGHGTITIVSVIICTKYFSKKRALSVGISRCGTGFGTVIMAPLVELMLSKFGSKGAILVTASFTALCGISGLFMKPVPTIEKTAKIKKQYLVESGRKFDSTTGLQSEVVSTTYQSELNGKSFGGKYHESQIEESVSVQVVSKMHAIVTNMFSLKYMSEIGFHLFNIQRILYYIGLMTISIYLPNMIHLQPATNIDSTRISYIVSIIGGANTLARVLLGAISDLPMVNPIVVLVVANSIASISAFAMVYCQTFAAFASFGFIFGFATAPGNSLTSVVLANIFGVQALVTTFDMSNFFAGICIIPGPSFVGYIFQLLNENPNVPFYAASGILLMTALLNLILYTVNKYEVRCSKRRRIQTMYEEI